ncbi:Hsp70 family protein [Paenarthrobacter sp. NPDC056912]|uniref:Hsp70 family protein n=1 Tax=Paenarthrobacter sp. NPDC056912 TaxID=3345965 RepID=UPI00366C70F7
MNYVLAIDVGTSFTAAALVKPDQSPTPTPEILPLGLHGSAVPSVLFYAADGRVLVGEGAERRGLDDPQRMVREFKRRIGDSVPLAVGEGWLAPEDVYATLARWVVDRAEEREGVPPSSIMMTYPAAWGQHRTSVVLAALNVAGLPAVTLISEPVAAAVHYASQTRVDDGSIIAVYDLGGGTFDTAVLRKASAGNFELLGRPDGIETLGGADFDAAVLRHVLGFVAGATDLDPQAPATLAALSRLRRECREAKEALSLDSEASVAVALPGTQQSVRLVRSEFEAMIEEPVRSTVDALERSLRSIRLEPQDLSAVLLIGGSSRIPLVAELISVELDRPIAVDADPKSSICLGAAIAGLRSNGLAAVDAKEARDAAAAAKEAARPHVARPLRALPAPKAGPVKPKHGPRPRVRMTAAAAAAATVLTVVTATAAQSPEGTGLLASMFDSQAADVMRDGGSQAAPAQATNAGGAPAATSPAGGKPTAGLEASARAGVARAGTATGRTPAKQGTAATGTGAVSGPSSSGAAVGGTGAAPAGTSGAASPASPAAGTPTTTPGSSTPAPSQPPATTPATTPAPQPTGGAATGPATPPPVPEPTTPPATTPPTTPADPVTPSPEPTVPQPEPSATIEPAPVTPSADPVPVPSPTVTESSPTDPTQSLAV